MIMHSAAYQRASAYQDPNNLAVDADNRYLWRMNRRRLEAEALWDFVHSAAGTLNLKMGGRPVVPPLADDEMSALREPWQWTVSADPTQHTRRGLYLIVRRNFRFPMFEVFDSPVNSVSSSRRDVTIVAPQTLWSLNNRRPSARPGDSPAAWSAKPARSPRRASSAPGRSRWRGHRADAEKTEALQLIDSLAAADWIDPGARRSAGRAGQAAAGAGRGAGETVPGDFQSERVHVRRLKRTNRAFDGDDWMSCTTCCHRHEVPLSRREALCAPAAGWARWRWAVCSRRDGSLAAGTAGDAPASIRWRPSRRIFPPRPGA